MDRHLNLVSQNQQTQTGKAGRTIQGHVEQGVPVYLFIRKTKKIGSKAAPFVYCGDVEFEDWEGNKPGASLGIRPCPTARRSVFVTLFSSEFLQDARVCRLPLAGQIVTGRLAKGVQHD